MNRARKAKPLNTKVLFDAAVYNLELNLERKEQLEALVSRINKLEALVPQPKPKRDYKLLLSKAYIALVIVGLITLGIMVPLAGQLIVGVIAALGFAVALAKVLEHYDVC